LLNALKQIYLPVDAAEFIIIQQDFEAYL